MAKKKQSVPVPLYRLNDIRRAERGLSIALSVITIPVVAYQLLSTIIMIFWHLSGYFEGDTLGIKTGISGLLFMLPVGALFITFPLNFFAANFIGGVEYNKKESAPVLRRYIAYAWMQVLLMVHLSFYAFNSVMPKGLTSFFMLALISVPFLVINIYMYRLKFKNPKITLYIIKFTRVILLGVNLLLILGILYGIAKSQIK